MAVYSLGGETLRKKDSSIMFIATVTDSRHSRDISFDPSVEFSFSSIDLMMT